MKILIKGARLIDPAGRVDMKGDLLIDKGKIAGKGKALKDPEAKQIDAVGKIVSPGFIDMHAHLREPGREDAETIESGMECALRGGFTTICAMPNTDPPCETAGDVQYLRQRAKEAGKAKLLPVGAMTKGRKGAEMTEMKELYEAGCPAVSDDGDPLLDAGIARKVMEYASMCGLLVISHCEDKSLSGDGVMHEGYWSTMLGLSPIPARSETTIVERDISMAELGGTRIHIAHVSCSESVEIIKRAKKRGVQVTAEVTPHHFSLTDEDLKEYDTNFKVNPPLRSKEDVKAIIEAIKEGVIDVIATDHAPHPENEKEKEFDHAPFGMIGLETALSLGYMYLVEKGHLDWMGFIEKLTINPARILGTPTGTLAEGAPADVVIIDPEEEWVYEKKNIRSLSKNSPFIGKKMRARVKCAIVDGKIVFKSP